MSACRCRGSATASPASPMLRATAVPAARMASLWTMAANSTAPGRRDRPSPPRLDSPDQPPKRDGNAASNRSRAHQPTPGRGAIRHGQTPQYLDSSTNGPREAVLCDTYRVGQDLNLSAPLSASSQKPVGVSIWPTDDALLVLPAAQRATLERQTLSALRKPGGSGCGLHTAGSAVRTETTKDWVSMIHSLRPLGPWTAYPSLAPACDFAPAYPWLVAAIGPPVGQLAASTSRKA